MTTQTCANSFTLNEACVACSYSAQRCRRALVAFGASSIVYGLLVAGRLHLLKRDRRTAKDATIPLDEQSQRTKTTKLNLFSALMC